MKEKSKVRVTVAVTLPTDVRFLMLRPDISIERECNREDEDATYEEIKKDALAKLDDLTKDLHDFATKAS